MVDAGDFAHPLWNVTPFIDLVMPGQYEWDWEREWRVRSHLRFRHQDVAFVVTPEGIEELPGVDGFYVHPKHDPIVSASPQPLEEYLEDLVQQFFQAFEDPATASQSTAASTSGSCRSGRPTMPWTNCSRS